MEIRPSEFLTCNVRTALTASPPASNNSQTSGLKKQFFATISRFLNLCTIPLVRFLLASMAVSPTVACSSDPPENGHPRVFRTFMPEAGPSAFAVELSEHVAFCYDPLRGGINQLWNGNIDLSPTFQAKINHPAKIVGTIFYAETLTHPLRLTNLGTTAEYRFKGYRYKEDAVVFDFTLHGLPVTETLRLSEDGRGLVREFSLPKGGGPAFLTLQVQPAANVTVSGGSEIKPGEWKFSEGSHFSIQITPKAKHAK